MQLLATHLDSSNQVLLNIISILDILEYGYHCICKGPWIKRDGDIPFASLDLRSPAKQKQLVSGQSWADGAQLSPLAATCCGCEILSREG